MDEEGDVFFTPKKELFDPTWLDSKLGEIYKDLVIFKVFSCLLPVLHNNCNIDLLEG